MTTFNIGDRVSFEYLTEKNEVINVVGVVSEPSKGRPMIVQLDVPRKRADSPRLQTHITVRTERIRVA